MKGAIPAAVGGSDPMMPPLVACYVSITGYSAYYPVSFGASGTSDPYCFLQLQTDGLYHVSMYNMSSNETATFVVLY